MSVGAPTAGDPFLLARLLNDLPTFGSGGWTIMSEFSEAAVKVHVQALGACNRLPPMDRVTPDAALAAASERHADRGDDNVQVTGIRDASTLARLAMARNGCMKSNALWRPRSKTSRQVWVQPFRRVGSHRFRGSWRWSAVEDGAAGACVDFRNS